MLKRFVVIFVCVLLFVSMFVVSVPTVCSQSTNVEVLSYSWYISSSQNFAAVIGEFQNVGQNNIEFVALTGYVDTFAEDDEAWSTNTGYSSEILPQQKVPFVLYFFPDKSYSGSFDWGSANFNNVWFEVIASTETENYQYPNLEIVDDSSEIEIDGTFTVTGNIKNTGNEPTGKVWVVATFYNASGSVVATGFSDYLIPNSLEAGQTASFTVNTIDAVPNLTNEMRLLAYKITSYSLLIQTEAPIIPEFQSEAIMLFAITSAIVLFYKKKTECSYN